jgi:carboxypeptidase Taq
VQFIESVRNDVQDLDEQISRGDFSGLFGWLRSRVHSQGARLTLQELLREATGKTLSAAPFMRYLEGKYLESVTSSAAA